MNHESALKRAIPTAINSVDFTGTWVNELNSVVVITQTSNSLSGTYTSSVSATGETTSGTLTGYVSGDLISFVVNWDDFQAITAWVGQLSPTNSSLFTTLWQMTTQVDGGSEWASILAGADSFYLQ